MSNQTNMPVSPPGLDSSAPRGLDVTVNREIAAIWTQVQARVLQLARDSSKEINSDLDIDGVLSLLDRVQRSRDTSSKKKAAIRAAFDNTLQLIQSIGEVAAFAAGVAFAPTRACYTALSLAIEAWQGYEGVFESMAGLLEKCSHYLSRLPYYVRGGMDTKLSKVCCQHLQLFVEICDRVIKLRQKRHRFMTFTKLFFFNDNGIDDLLQKMDSLVDSEGHLVAAQTFQFASEAASNSRKSLSISKSMDNKMDALVEDRADRWKEKESRTREEILLRALAFDDDKMDWRKKEPDPYWLATYHNYRNMAIQSTGRWIFNEPQYVAWESGPSGPAILAIEGPEGSGKSFLASTIIHRLRKISAAGNTGSRNLVAFYFLEGDPKEELKNADNLGVIVKSIVWQLAQLDTSYLKSVANKCQKIEDFDPHEITAQLLLENEDLATIDARIFIIIEGVDDVGRGDPLIRFLRKVSSLPQDRDIRVLLTGRPRGIDPLVKSRDISIENIQINSRNRADVEKYVQFKMDRIDALKDTTRLGVAELRRKISDTLSDKTAGDYFKMDTILKRIRGLDYVHDIDRVLDNAGQERSQHILGEIEQLNDTRTPKEIGEINEIILWILHGRQWLSPRQMSAVLYVKSGELSLLSLGDKFQTKFSLFEVDNDGDVDFRSSETADLIPERHRWYEDLGSSANVQHSEVAMLRHFLNTVCPPDVYAKFDFDDFFDRKINHKRDCISRDDKDTAEVKLAVTCLRILTEERDERRERLHPYAMQYFLEHLSAADLAVVDREWKDTVGPLLLKLFSDDRSIDALFWTSGQGDESVLGHLMRSVWVDNDDAVDEILRWFKDSTVISQISDKNARKWISDLTKRKPAEHLLKPAAKRIAMHWLREASPAPLVRHAFILILGFLNKLESRGSDVDEGYVGLVPPIEKVLEVEEWALGMLEIEAKDATSEVQMGSLLNSFSHSAEAEKRYRHALELEPFNCRAIYNLATMLESPDEAIALLKSESERYETGDEWLAYHKGLFADILFELGQRYWQKGEYDVAVQSYKRSIDADVTGYERALEVMEQYQAEQRWPDIEGVLEIIQKGSERVKDNLAEMVVELAESEPLHDMLLHAMSKTCQLGVLEMVYDSAIELATRGREYDKLFYIRYYYAAFLNQRPENEERAVALWEKALNDDLPRSSLDIEATLPSVIVKLGPIYLGRARTSVREADVQRNLDKISDLIPDEAVESKLTLPANLYLARYHHVNGNETQAKQITRSMVKLALELLCDGDESSDYTAYWKLLLVFLPFNDDVNAVTASVMASRVSEMAYTRSADPENDHYLPLADCDGCGRYIGSGRVMWWCRDCIDMTFDEGCFQKMKSGTLARRICSAKHEFLAIPVWDGKKLRGLKKGVVPVGEKMVSFEEWKGDVRRKYVDFSSRF